MLTNLVIINYLYIIFIAVHVLAYFSYLGPEVPYYYYYIYLWVLNLAIWLL